jgi:hypothetical protein
MSNIYNSSHNVLSSLAGVYHATVFRPSRFRENLKCVLKLLNYQKKIGFLENVVVQPLGSVPRFAEFDGSDKSERGTSPRDLSEISANRGTEPEVFETLPFKGIVVVQVESAS